MRDIIKKLQIFKPYEQVALLLSRESINEAEKKYVQEILKIENFSWDGFLGLILNNRVNGVVYSNLKCFENIPQRVLYTLNMMFLAAKKRNAKHQEEIQKLFNRLEKENIKYSFLKGSVLNSLYYNCGERISNDTDIMVDPGCLKKISSVLTELGYKQGKLKNNQIVKATKKQIAFARLNTYEIVPFLKTMDSDFFPIHTVDINFKLTNLEKIGFSADILNNTIILEHEGRGIRTLSKENFLLFLSIHLYREATLMLKILSGGDLLLYKFMDVHFFIEKNKDSIKWELLYEEAKKLNLLNDVYYSLYFTEFLYPDTISDDTLEMFKPQNVSYLNEYYGDSEKKDVFIWEQPFNKRIFNPNRKKEAINNISNQEKRMTEIYKNLEEE